MSRNIKEIGVRSKQETRRQRQLVLQLDWKLETEHKAEIELKNHFKIKKEMQLINNSCTEPSL